MPRKQYPHVQTQLIKGRLYHYFRREGCPRVRLPGPIGSEEFLAAYERALAAGSPPVGSARTIPRSLDDLAARWYASGEFRDLAPLTASTYQNALERIRKNHGRKSVADMKAKHVRALMEEGATADAANRILKIIRRVMTYAVDSGWRDDNPATGVKARRTKADGFATWEEEDIEQFRAFYPSGTRERLALELLLNTGSRRSDMVKLGWQHVKHGCIHMKQTKTRAAVSPPILPELQKELDLRPRDRLTFLLTAYGKPFTPAGFGNEFRDVVDAAGLPERVTDTGKVQKLSAHGLRKACAVRLAEAGCSPHEIKAITGHKSLREVERYCQEANQKRLARQATEKLAASLGGAKREPEL
jgi:integrase